MKKKVAHLKINTALESEIKINSNIFTNPNQKVLLTETKVNKKLKLKMSPPSTDSKSLNGSIKTNKFPLEKTSIIRRKTLNNELNSRSLSKPGDNLLKSEREPINHVTKKIYSSKNTTNFSDKIKDYLTTSSKNKKELNNLTINNERTERVETEPTVIINSNKILPEFSKNFFKPENNAGINNMIKPLTPRNNTIVNKLSPINAEDANLDNNCISSKLNKNNLNNNTDENNANNSNINNDEDNNKNNSVNTINSSNINSNVKLFMKQSTPKIENSINLMTLFSSQHTSLSTNILKQNFQNFENSKQSTKANSSVKAYAANTHQGTVRNYNEDRVSIILNILQPNTFTGKYWPKCSVFGVYDGHGGSGCADYLRDNLYQFVIKDSNFPDNPKEAIFKGFESAEKDFLNNYALNKNGDIKDRSGSCAIVIFVVDDVCYVANVGDSRAVMSSNGGNNIEVISIDHKPSDENEELRIVAAGGKVYQTQTPTRNLNLSAFNGTYNLNLTPNHILLGPFRVLPGRLSVSRAFGDVEAKLTKFGGNCNVVIATPEVTSFKITDNSDFVLLGCDGIYDQLSNKEVIDCVWMATKENKDFNTTTRSKSVHSQCSLGVDMIVKTCLFRKCMDNVTCIIVAFENFEKHLSGNNNLNNNYYLNTAPSKSTTGSPNNNVSLFTQNTESPTKLKFKNNIEKPYEPLSTEPHQNSKYKSNEILDFNSKENNKNFKINKIPPLLENFNKTESSIKKKIINDRLILHKKGIANSEIPVGVKFFNSPIINVPNLSNSKNVAKFNTNNSINKNQSKKEISQSNKNVTNFTNSSYKLLVPERKMTLPSFKNDYLNSKTNTDESLKLKNNFL